MSPDDLRRQASVLLRLARLVEANKASERVREAEAALRSSRTLIAAARRQLARPAQ